MPKLVSTQIMFVVDTLDNYYETDRVLCIGNYINRKVEWYLPTVLLVFLDINCLLYKYKQYI